MRSSVFILPFAAAIALAGCGKKDEAPAGKTGEAAPAGSVSTATIGLRPGQYEATIEMLEMTIPGMPAGMAKEMAKRNGPTKISYCVTEQEAAQSVKQMLGKAQTGNCSFKTYDVSGGHITTEMACKNPDGTEGTIKTSGTISSEAMDTVGEIDFPGMKSKTHTTFKRVGDCKA
ncbi:MAG: DUF3617 domain-containing protein [Candidatus Andeanibacterium colombiense]|uniref:DUF3617 domain-containing protein n=1 Tax=Candidatus Andeanibacterium colombiense TaxID=3121345 RepID=A0AAJ6BPH1_9SPHN|nr:MAG: DUF3617 domain-containing protein [Sphingomonadaceae bacterium]